MYADELQRATLDLPSGVGCWVSRALKSGWFRVEPGDYENGGPGGAVCPIVAAATMAGLWSNGELLPGNPAWGSPSGPTAEIEDFAAYFDLCAEEFSTVIAIRIVNETLDSAAHAQCGSVLAVGASSAV